MPKVAIVADTNCGLTRKEAEKLGVYLVPMPFSINYKTYHEGVDITEKELFELMESGAEVRTSQPSPADVCDIWDKALETHDEVVYIPMSSALSSTCASAVALAADYDGKVQVVDNRRLSVTHYSSILDAIKLMEYGTDAEEIKKILEKHALEAPIYVTVNNLEHLKKGGRITPAAAGIATILNLKPVLYYHGDKLDSYKKVRGMEKAKLAMIDAIKKEIEETYKYTNYRLFVAYSGDKKEAEKWHKQFAHEFPGREVIMHHLPLSLCCHVGDGVLGAAVAKML
ncbi:MAG: DegV family protein [Clostridia bacterium]|nr:DegV family protein [Clostridia bacterium]